MSMIGNEEIVVEKLQLLVIEKDSILLYIVAH